MVWGEEIGRVQHPAALENERSAYYDVTRTQPCTAHD